jgi:pre-mRNA-splicing factor 38B
MLSMRILFSSPELVVMAPNNPLPVHGNEKTMNLNHLILTNIQASPYFKVQLYELKTYHEVIDEIFYKVRVGR